MARRQAAVARLKSSNAVSSGALLLLLRMARGVPGGVSRGRLLGRLHAGLGDLVAEAALIVLGHDRPLDLVALVEEGQAEGELQVAAEDVSVLQIGRAHV